MALEHGIHHLQAVWLVDSCFTDALSKLLFSLSSTKNLLFNLVIADTVRHSRRCSKKHCSPQPSTPHGSCATAQITKCPRGRKTHLRFECRTGRVRPHFDETGSLSTIQGGRMLAELDTAARSSTSARGVMGLNMPISWPRRVQLTTMIPGNLQINLGDSGTSQHPSSLTSDSICKAILLCYYRCATSDTRKSAQAS